MVNFDDLLSRLDGLELNWEEFFLGLTFALSFAFFVGPIAAAIAGIFCGLLWSAGGAGLGRAWRYAGVPMVIFVALLIALPQLAWYYKIVSSVLAGAVLTVGYGIPSTQPPDEGSALGRFVFRIFKEEWTANLAARLIIAFLLALAYFPLAIISAELYAVMVGCLCFLHLFVVIFVDGVFKL